MRSFSKNNLFSSKWIAELLNKYKYLYKDFIAQFNSITITNSLLKS